jgi:hypothetical protein
MKYTLKAQTINLLKQVITFPGWTKEIEEIYRGGKLLVEVLPEIKDGTNSDLPTEVELCQPDIELCRRAFAHALSKEMVPTSKWTNDLIEKLEFTSKPKPQ